MYIYIYIFLSISHEVEKKGSWRFIEHRYIFRYPTFFALSIVIFAHHEGIRALFCALHVVFGDALDGMFHKMIDILQINDVSA